MLLKRFCNKVVCVFVCAVCVLCACFCSCSLAATPRGYAAIWRAGNDDARKTAAVACFDALANQQNTVQNVTKHMLKHLKVPSELQNKNVLQRSMLVWLSYEGFGQQMGTLRTLLSDLYAIGSDVIKMRQWVFYNANNTNVTPAIYASVKKVATFARLLQKNRGVIDAAVEILHVYAVDVEASNHKTEDMEAIDQFLQFFNCLMDSNTISKTISDGHVDKLLNVSVGQTRQKLIRLLYLQRNLFERMNLMTAKMLKECFEPCVTAIMRNAFHLQGTVHGGVVPENDMQAGGLPDNILLGDYSEHEATSIIHRLDLASIDENPDNAAPLEEIPARSSTTTTVLKRTFKTGAEITQFIRSVVLITNTGCRQKFQGLVQGVERVVDVANCTDSTELVGGSLIAPIVADLQTVVPTNDDEYTIVRRKADLQTVVPTNDDEYTIARRKIVGNPFLASLYLKIG